MKGPGIVAGDRAKGNETLGELEALRAMLPDQGTAAEAKGKVAVAPQIRAAFLHRHLRTLARRDPSLDQGNHSETRKFRLDGASI